MVHHYRIKWARYMYWSMLLIFIFALQGVLASSVPDPSTSGSNLSMQKATDGGEIQSASLQINFMGMNPHIGQKLELRVVNKANRKEVGRTGVDMIPSADFSLNLMGVLEVGGSYQVDFYADFNNNGLYDPPPTDHAWRLNLNNVKGDTTLQFVHNINFVDIQWQYLLTMNLTSMNPHVNQKFEMRVWDKNSGKEIGRETVGAIPSPDFGVSIPGIKIGGSYYVDFYADFNGNSLYDSPPTDHAWREEVNNVQGDTVLNFVHNINFTDIQWNYLFTMNLMSMNPHLGQLFELRVVDEMTGNEIGRTRLDSILVPDFEVSVPGLELGRQYRADFYADFNNNGHYDSPPADHAWRETFTDTTGDVTIDFTHNINFTNIDWPTAITPIPQAGVPVEYSLWQNYPNPFNPITNIRFQIPRAGKVTLEVYNLLGQRIRALVNEVLQPGTYNVTWDGKNENGQPLGSGIYFYRLRTKKFTKSYRMILLK